MPTSTTSRKRRRVATETAAIPGKEEYLDSEKYQLRAWDWDRPGNIREDVALVNRLRRGNPALHDFTNLEFYNAWNDHILVYGRRTPDLSSFVLIAVNLDPHNVQAAHFEVPLWEFGRSDDASIGVDIRTVPGMSHQKLIKNIKDLLGSEVEIDIFSDLPPVWTEPDDEWMQRVFEICKPHLGAAPQPRTATYMTDAANLLKVYQGAPTVVLGPGEPQMAHQTDEYCSVERLERSVALYEALIRDWIS